MWRITFLAVGYFVTKQPSPKELEEKISFDEARQREREFFDSENPWKDKDHLKSQMGTSNLTNALSNLLGKVINDAYVNHWPLSSFHALQLALKHPRSSGPVQTICSRSSRVACETSTTTIRKPCRRAFAACDWFLE